MMPMDSIFNIAMEAFNNKDYNLLASILIGGVFLWLYSEFRKNYNTTKSENKLDLENALESYSKLYYAITAFQLNKIEVEELYEHISQTIVFLPKKFAQEILKIDVGITTRDSSELQDIKTQIKNHINFLKSKQYTISTYDPNGDIFDQGSWFLSRNNFDSFILTLIYAFFALIGFMYLLLFGEMMLRLSGIAQINFILILLNLIFVLILLTYILDFALKKLLRKEALCYFLGLGLLPWIVCTFVINLNYSFINTITLILFIYLANKRKFMRPI